MQKRVSVLSPLVIAADQEYRSIEVVPDLLSSQSF